MIKQSIALHKSFFVHLFLITACFLFSNHSYGQIETPKYVNEYLAIGVGARALAMGNSQTELVNDATAGYWNPAGLLNILYHPL